MARVINVLYGGGDETDIKPDMKAYFKRIMDLDWEQVVWDGTVTVPGISQNRELLTQLRKFVSSERISLDPADRMRHSLGSSSLEMVRARKGSLPEPVDAVISPLDHEAEDFVASFRRPSTALTIYGGGTSVTGGIISRHGADTVCIDTSNLKDFQLNERIAVAGAGLTGKEIETRLNSEGRTLGFFPESVAHSTLGGWIATRATGQESNQYGDIEGILLGVRLARSNGVSKDTELPRYSAGPMAKDVALGSEGHNGLVLSASLETYPLPLDRFFSTHMFPSFSSAVKQISEMRIFPSVLRLMDETETELSLLEVDQRTRRILRRYLGLRGIINGSLAIVVNNDSPFKRHIPGSVWLGQSGAARWFKTRFERPRLANALWKRGVTVDTLETSCSWESVEKIHSTVTSTFYRIIREGNAAGVIMSHLSHQYHAGTCIYFTFLIKGEDDEKVLEEARDGILESIISNSGSITHHHGLGTYFTRYVSKDMKAFQDSLRDPIFDGNQAEE